ncbi:Tetratricopeptide repeat protein [compost metagenome]
MKNVLLIVLLAVSLTGWTQKTANDYFDQAILKAEKGNTQGAITDYTKAIKLNPKFAEAYLNRAVERIKVNNLTGALSDANMTDQVQKLGIRQKD